MLGCKVVSAQCITYTYDNLGNRIARAGNCPNPSPGQVTIRYYLAKGQEANIDFVNVAGVVVLVKTLVGEEEWQEDKTDLSTMPNGVYTLRWKSKGKQITKKLLIAK